MSCPVCQCVSSILVVHPHNRVPQTNDEFYITPAVAAADIYPERVSDYSDRVGAPFCVLGEAFHGHLVLMMDPSSRVYAGYDDALLRVGDSGIDAIEALCSGQDMPKVS